MLLEGGGKKGVLHRNSFSLAEPAARGEKGKEKRGEGQVDAPQNPPHAEEGGGERVEALPIFSSNLDFPL